ncbi:MAG: DOMON-like domain-containing protein [Syntrophorhabdus sp.]|jgi:hypothetical protein|nr:DOMON-like domain-containing protein [Syntrophorhabdus sp.]
MYKKQDDQDGRQAFSLRPFEEDGSLSGIECKGYLARRIDTLSVHYEIIGGSLSIDIPGRTREPSRKKGLWENTCLELFVAVKDRDRYWEFNLSPSGDWNVFRFEHYRNERHVDTLREESLVVSLPFTTERRSGSFLLDMEFDLDTLVRKDDSLEIGIGAIITFNEGRTCWALTHCGPRPDFHRRDSFIMKL